MGYRIPFLSHHPLSLVPIPMPSYNPLSTKGVALEEVTLDLVTKGAVELAPLPSPGFYSFVDVSHFQKETIQSVLLSVRQGDWMASIDLREAYLQVPVHPESRPFLRFVSKGHVFQFKALCFGLSTAPQVFSRVMAPVSAILHSMGIRMHRYLDDWLVQSSSRESLLRDLQTVLGLCHELGVVINLEKSHLIPSQVVQYLSVVINTQSFVASPSPDRISRLLSTAGEFRSSASPPASLWLSLLGMLSSLAHLVPGGRLRMRSLQLCLNRSWDHVDLSIPVAWSAECLQDLQWWLHLPRLSQGVSPCQVSPNPSGSSVHPGLQQRPSGCSVSPSPAAAFRVVPQHDRVSVFMLSVAGADRFVCDLCKSPLLDLFFALPRPSVCRHGRLPPVLGRSTGLRLSSVCHHSQSPCKTPRILGDGAHPCGSALGTAPLVSRPPPAVAGPSGHLP